MADSGKTTASGRSGTSSSGDSTGNPGYPPGDWATELFGGPLPTGTGAPGTQGGKTAGLDSTNEIGQVSDSLTGVSDHDVTSTGAPGTLGAGDAKSGGTSVTYTTPSDGIGPYTDTTVSEDLDGPGDSTQANDSGYASGGPQLPGLKGNEPQAGTGRFQPGAGGHVMRGGRAVRP